MAKVKITYNGSVQEKGAANSPYRMETGGKLMSTDILVEPVVTADDLQYKSFTPTESTISVTPDSGYIGLEQVTVNAITPTYVGSEVSRKTSADLHDVNGLVTVPSGYYANDETHQVRAAALTPYRYDYPIGYITTASNTGAKWIWEDQGLCFIDIYEVTAGGRFLITLGGNVGTRFRIGFFTTDITTVPEPQSSSDPGTVNNPIMGEHILSVNDPVAYRSQVWTSTANVGVDGYLCIQKDNAGTSGLYTYVYGPDQWV